jgi:hypothetical protein
MRSPKPTITVKSGSVPRSAGRVKERRPELRDLRVEVEANRADQAVPHSSHSSRPIRLVG